MLLSNFQFCCNNCTGNTYLLIFTQYLTRTSSDLLVNFIESSISHGRECIVNDNVIKCLTDDVSKYIVKLLQLFLYSYIDNFRRRIAFKLRFCFYCLSLARFT